MVEECIGASVSLGPYADQVYKSVIRYGKLDICIVSWMKLKQFSRSMAEIYVMTYLAPLIGIKPVTYLKFFWWKILNVWKYVIKCSM